MTKRPLFLLFIVLALTMVSCSGTQPVSQLKIGIWAAEHDLWEEAVYRWTRVLQSNPNSAAAHNNLAVAYEKKGMVAEAKREYELALKLAPKNTHVRSNYDRFKSNTEPKEDKPAPPKPQKDKPRP